MNENEDETDHDGYIFNRLEDLILLLGTRFELSPEQAANQVLLCLICYASTVLDGPFEEPLKTEVEIYREPDEPPPARDGVVVALRARKRRDDEGPKR